MNSFIWVDNQPIKTSYFMQNGHVMVPALFFKHTGATVDWNTKYQSVDLERHNIVSFPSEKNYMDYYIRKSGKWLRDKTCYNYHFPRIRNLYSISNYSSENGHESNL